VIIERIEISNYRALRQIDLTCDNMLAIIGRNGAGKSSILYALETFYNVAAQITEYDYFDRDTHSDIKIRVTYGQLRDDEKTEFASYLSDNKLIVTKVINSGGAKYYGASRQLPEFAEIRKLGPVPKRQKFNELVDSEKYPDLNQRVNSGPKADEAMEMFETAHPELLELFQRETQFFGPRNIGGGKLDNFTKFVLIPAVRDASSETERRGAILQLIDILVMRSINARSDVRQLNDEFERRVKEVYSTDNLTELRALGEMITDILKKYAPGAELDLEFGEVNPPKIALPPAMASLIEDNFKCPIAYSGHGLQRALIFALLQQLSITELSQADQSTQTEDDEQTHTVPYKIPDLILAIEEPELYLHPSRCRYLSKVMFDLSTQPDQNDEPRTQILYGTHSPFFIDIQRFDQVRLARKVSITDTTTLQTKITSFTRAEAARQLAQISLRSEGIFTDATFTARATTVMTTIVNEGFFADATVVVEGLSDAAVLWVIQEIMSLNWDALGISVVPVVGKNNIDRPVVVFRGFEIPTYFIFDADSRHIGTDKENNTITSNQLLLRLAGVDVENFPNTGAFDTWAVFKDDLENELKLVLGDTRFQEIRQNIADELSYTQPSQVLKNPDGAGRFIRTIYDNGHSIPILEDIASRVTTMRNAR
jgi:putative ATP-dependent endonuclease of the OLD family